MKRLKETMRWYGPHDRVSLADIAQAGASGVVTALHHIPNGIAWPLDAIQERKELIEQAGMEWSVVESVPIHEDIKIRSGNYERYIDNYKKTIANLAEAGIPIICYNFMPVLDWTRTDLAFEMPDGGKALRFEKKALIAFDCFILDRPGAKSEYSREAFDEALRYYNSLDDLKIEKLKETILAGLPGAEEGYKLEDFRLALDSYRDITGAELSENLSSFLKEIIPVAEKHGIRMALHPDDPPFPILGLPRVVSTAEDIERILSNPLSPSNGVTFCTGSFGVRADNDLEKMVDKFKDRIYFVHLRSTQRDSEGNFYEAAHLEGDVPMYELVSKLMAINAKRNQSIPMRPDHGHQILDDLDKPSNPGYSAIGRLKGLAEIRGLMHAIARR